LKSTKSAINILLFLSVVVFSSCSSTRRVSDGEYLLTENRIVLSDSKIDRETMKSVVRPKPNRKILGLLRFHLSVFNMVNEEKAIAKKQKMVQKRVEKNLKREKKDKKPKSLDFTTRREWLLNIGEKPVLYDKDLVRTSDRQLNLYLFKKGYFNNSVKDTVEFKGKKASVIYMIEAGKPYILKDISYTIYDNTLDQFVQNELTKSYLKPGDNYDEDNILRERDRITKSLQNVGYFYFTKEYIHFKIDTSAGDHKVNIEVELKNPEVRVPDSEFTVETRHKRYRINNIYISTSYNPRATSVTYSDTLEFLDMYFLHNRDLDYKPNVLTQRIFIKTGDYYQLKNLEETYKKLSDLRVFKFTNIQFTEESNDIQNNLLNCHIMLSPVVKQSINIETEGTNRDIALGVAGNIVYTNNNPFKGAERLELRLKGGLESQVIDQETNIADDNISLFFFNTKEFGPEATLTMPRFLLPIKPERFSKYFTPKTTISAAYNFQERPDFKRHIVNLTFGYNWKESPSKTHFISLADINIVNMDITGSLSDFFDRINNPFIERSFTPHATISSRYTFLFNNQSLRKNKDFMFFRTSLEGAGNLLRGIYNLVDAPSNEFGSYEIAPGTPFAQFVKFDADFRYYKVLNKKNNLVYRVAFGAGKPLSNLNVLPLERSYFGGGSNGIRAWAARSLGPGTYTDITSFNTLRIGDLSIESNIEYRFDLYKMLEGAFFVDAGNIWLLRDDPARPGGEFKFNSFHKEFAIGTGVGIRLDFSFFIFRLDIGIKVRDPMIDSDDKWVGRHIFDNNWKQDNLPLGGRNYFRNINFGIGYPF
jgi:outer membrane protein assembly factor BamA